MDSAVFNQFMTYLKNEDKHSAVKLAISCLEEGKMDIETLYQELLAPSLMLFSCDVGDEDICIWKEHFRTSVIRTILEISYVYILKRLDQVKKNQIKIVVLTPAFEYHEIGAIMNTHFLLLEGFNACYIGANTPKSEILSAIRAYEPDYVALSVTNPYNIVISKQTTDEIKRFFPEVGIILGGQAFKDPNVLKTLSYHYVLQSLDDLKRFKEEVTK